MCKKRIIALLLVFMMVFAVALTGCDDKQADTSTDTSASTEKTETKEESPKAEEVTEEAALEAPVLAEKVASGDLPALEERLPEVPLVVEPLDSVGTYGGTWRNMIIAGDTTHIVRYQGYETLLRWTPEWDGYITNIAEKYEVNDESTEFTFYLRKGMKWSDGEPFTAADFEFKFNDVWGNETLAEQDYPSYFKSGGEPATLTVIDDYTIKYTFTEPNGLFLLGVSDVNSPAYAPKHYMEQFHIDYNDKADELAKENDYADWIEHITAQMDGLVGTNYVERPVIDPWMFEVLPDGTTPQAKSVRNPYYWKVDTDGKQLPYIDEITYDMVSDVEVAVMKAANGEIDYHDQNIATPGNKPLLYQSQEQGNFHFATTTMSAPNAMNIIFNLTHPDPVKRDVYSNKDFRIGMSYAINRQEIIDIVFAGQGIPHQTAPRPEAKLYNEELATQYTEYDVDLANEYLDKVLPDKDAEGMRLLPNGEKLIVQFDIDQARPTFIDAIELMTGYWKAVGIEIKVDVVTRDLWEERTRQGGTFDASMHRFGGGTGTLVLTDPRYYFPNSYNSFYAMPWAAYYLDPTGEGTRVPPEEPPADVLQSMDLYKELLVTGDSTAQEDIMKEILEIATEQFYTIGVCTEPDSYAVVNNDLVNVPEAMPWNWTYPHPAPTNPSTWYFSK